MTSETALSGAAMRRDRPILAAIAAIVAAIAATLVADWLWQMAAGAAISFANTGAVSKDFLDNFQNAPLKTMKSAGLVGKNPALYLKMDLLINWMEGWGSYYSAVWVAKRITKAPKQSYIVWGLVGTYVFFAILLVLAGGISGFDEDTFLDLGEIAAVIAVTISTYKGWWTFLRKKAG
jgi:hypothetical protein